ncbi:MAG: carbonic anhydrase [Gemmataceae bacterium]|nr:carbonic anhydrase [Gemmataceae bacterium]
MTRIMQGALDFQNRVHADKKELFERLGQGQHPLALFITCSDSRISPDLLAQAEPGQLFVLRNAGNIVPPYGTVGGGEDATIEYAVKNLKVRDVILCGHAKCGAMHGLLHPEDLGGLPSVAKWVSHSRSVLDLLGDAPADPEERLTWAVEQNVLAQMGHLHTHPTVKEALEARTLRLHGWVYDFERGLVTVYDGVAGKFVPLLDSLRKKMLDDAEDKGGPRSEWQKRG